MSMSRLLIGALLMASTYSAAEEAPRYKQLLAMDLGDMLEVDVATGTAKELSEAPAVVSVITAQDIYRMGARTLAEAVERVPGLHISVSTNRENNMFSARGIRNASATPQMLVLIDGVEIYELTANATPYAFRYPVSAIERIEIIRGPGSAVYGADAFSGVINVITRSPEGKNEASVGMNVGSFDYVETWVNGDVKFDEVLFNFSLSHEHQGNDDERLSPYGVIQQDREMYNFHLNAVWQEFTLKNWYWRAKKDMGIGAGLVGNDIDRDKSDFLKSQLLWNGSLTGDLAAQFDVAYTKSSFDARFQLLPPGVWPVGSDGNLFLPPFTPVAFPDGVIGHPQGENERFRLASALVYSGADEHRVRIGFGAETTEFNNVREFKNFGPGVLDEVSRPLDLVSNTVVDVTGTPFIYTPNYDRDIWYLSLQDEWKFSEDWELTSGIRYDHYSDFGSTVNPRVALVWKNSESFTSKLMFGSAFRAPRVAELVFVNNPTTLGNPNLKPEKIRTWELAFDYHPDKSFAALLSVFSYQSENLIYLTQSFVYENIGEQDGRGAELEVSWQISDRFRLTGNLSYLDSDLPLLGQDKDAVPGVMTFHEISYQMSSQWLLTMQNYWIADRERELGDSRPMADDYVKTDLNVLWQPEATWSFRLSVKNLFNDHVVEPVPNSPLFAIGLGFPDDIPGQGRSFFATVDYRF